jgi:parvulin-like peptidyl-prolyl isomerase
VAGNPVVAVVGGTPIRLDQLVGPMKQADGLKFLLQLAVLQEARNLAARNGYTITEPDLQHERDVVIEDLRRQILDQQSSAIYSTTQPAGPTNQQLEDLLPRVLQQRGISDAEFRIKLETTACIRKVIEKDVLGTITDDEIHQRFNLLYGETVHVRVIRLDNLQQVAVAKQRLAIDDFSAVATQMSQDPISARIGGDLPPFSLQSPDYPAIFKEEAFKLKVGDVSEPVEVNGSFFLIKLIERIPPKAVSFADEKDYVTDLVRWEKVQAAIQMETNELGENVRREMLITDRELAEQYKARVAPASSAPPNPMTTPNSSGPGGSASPSPVNAPNWITPAAASPRATDSGTILPSVSAPPATAPGVSP